MTRLKFLLPVLVILALLAIPASLIAFGGPNAPTAMASINEPFRSVDFSGLPPQRTFAARDGTALAYRHYDAGAGSPSTPGKGSVVLVHGSSARGNSMHVVAEAFVAGGYDAYTLDMRGHGASGEKGRIDYIGQLEDDLVDFVAAVEPARPRTLAGFSAGGGFALRFAGSERQSLFDDYLLMAPFISQDAPTYRPGSGGWVDVGIPRIIGISILDGFGIRAFNDLPVTAFALDENAKEFLTPTYSFALATNFRPIADYAANIRAVRQPVAVVAGKDDEAFHAERYASLFERLEKDWPVTLVPGIGHIPLTLDKRAVDAVVGALDAMRARGDTTFLQVNKGSE